MRGMMRLRFGVLGVLLVTMLLPASVAAAGAEVTRGGNMWRDVVTDDFNICGWPSTFDSSGQDHFVVTIADAHHGHVTYEEVENYSVTIHDDPTVPESVRGVTWQGRNEFSFVLDFDPSTDRVLQHSVQTAFEGPFKSQIERITLFVAPDGTIQRDTDVLRWFSTAQCDQFA
jgi:hypothetical protein